MNSRTALMLCTNARGGMRSVVEAYTRDGLFDRWAFTMLWTHQEGSAASRLSLAFAAYVKMLVLILRNKVSFLHVHVAMRGSFWRKSVFSLTARLFKIPVVLHLHGSEMAHFYQGLPNVGKRMVEGVLEKADVVVVLSDSWRKFVSSIAPAANIHVVNNYVSLPATSSNGRNAAEFTVLFLGALGQRKGIYDLLESWPGVLKALPHARLLVGGNGEVDKATTRSIELGISHSVQFLGWVDGETKQEMLKSASAFVLPSYNEGLPMSVLEAMSWSVPVITTRVGGIPELISDGADGLLIEPGNVAQLTGELVRLGQDPVLRGRMGAAGRKRVAAEYSREVVIPKIEKIYGTLHEAALCRRPWR